MEALLIGIIFAIMSTLVFIFKFLNDKIYNYVKKT